MTDTPHVVIEYSVDGGATWYHGRTIPAWAADDGGQRKATRDRAHELHGDGVRVVTRVLPEDDPRAEVNRPPTMKKDSPGPYLAVHGVAHLPDVDTPTTGLCGVGGGRPA